MKFFTLFLTAFMVLSIQVVTAADSFELNYKKQNRWVAKEDAADLRNLLKTAKKQNMTQFYVKLPKENRTVTIERLVVLRDILEKQLKKAVTIEEVSGDAHKNQILVMFKKS